MNIPRAILLIGLACSSLALVASCTKVPLRAHSGGFDFISAHYFENEKTQYVFFAVSNLRPEQAKPSWPNRFDLKAEGTKSTSDKTDFVEIDFSSGVHQHSLVSCGGNRLCGSYSFKSEHAPSALRLRYRSHPDSNLSVETSISNSVHAGGISPDSQSAFVYGVFDQSNRRLQIRVHDNFGSPNSETVRSFGLKRRYRIHDVALADVSATSMNELAQSSGSHFLFPAGLCPDAANTLSEGSAPASGETRTSDETEVSSLDPSWWPKALSESESQGTACFKARLVDRQGHPVYEAKAIARRNPVLLPEPTILQSPLQTARTLPVVLSYCEGRADSDRLVAPQFLNYQRFILGAENQPVDACFAVGEEDRFAQDLERVLTQKLAAARSSDPQGGDFLFNVAIHHRLPPVIVRFHEIILKKLSERIAAERKLISPRLVGAFVYDSQAPEVRSLNIPPSAGVLWCPRMENIKKEAGENSADGTATSSNNDKSVSPSCTAYSGMSGKVKLGPLNFLIPIGTFPTVDAFLDHTQKNGDKGLSQNPKFVVRSVRTNGNSVTTEQGGQITFFDGERITLARNQGLKFCSDWDKENLLQSLAFRDSGSGSGSGSGSSSSVLNAGQAQMKLLSGESDAVIGVGLSWEHPFLGGISTDLPVTGQIFDVIPISKSFSSQRVIGDMKWHRESWKLGSVMQKCLRYCDHPVFDEAGVYQLSSTWRAQASRCWASKFPEAPR